MIIRFWLTFIKGAIPASALSFLHKLLTWLSNFSSWLIVIPGRTSLFAGINGQTVNHCSIMRLFLSVFAVMKLLLNHPNSSDEDVSSALITDPFFIRLLRKL